MTGARIVTLGAVGLASWCLGIAAALLIFGCATTPPTRGRAIAGELAACYRGTEGRPAPLRDRWCYCPARERARAAGIEWSEVTDWIAVGAFDTGGALGPGRCAP
jgi:hypothetical protein